MRELDDDDPRVQAGVKVITNYLYQNFVGRPFDRLVVERMRDVVDEFRLEFQVRFGAKFPPLTPLVVPSAQYIVWYRADLDNRMIHDKLLMLMKELRGRNVQITAVELAASVSACWPNYKPPTDGLRARGFKLQ